ncbi:hypothetical protein EI555_017090 [Monodon monoceros]|uniref:Uncharacterized protein n=1 Tax=Monodon monoceros TaxID=40151 RepID=A0A4U1EPQ2_MONMO|nr:hypothetical protein EI555_017090 [Monodon monoceros]
MDEYEILIRKEALVLWNLRMPGMQTMPYMNLMEKNSAVKGLQLNTLGLSLEAEEVEDATQTVLVVADLEMIDETLHLEIIIKDLKDFMRQAGEVTFADAHRPKLNEGVVEFASYGLLCLRRARNVVLQVDLCLQHLWIARGPGPGPGPGQGPDQLTVAIKL